VAALGLRQGTHAGVPLRGTLTWNGKTALKA
jgi:hypothetical protein